tara:strand:- start:231 stop:428 length:198 start_codon:yes stop_codon:yes gene_type:complete
VKIGDLISFKPKSFGDEDWSNPGIIIDSYVSKGFEFDDFLWVVWIDGSEYLVNDRVDDIIIFASS